MNITSRWVVLFLRLFLVASGVEGPFTVSISTKREYQSGEDIVCDVTIANSDSRDYSVLARKTPLEGLRSDIFTQLPGKERLYPTMES